MSLFGSSPPPSARASSSLFDDRPAPKAPPGTAAGLFADDSAGGGGGSPWDMPTPKRAARRNLVKTLLGGADVPGAYVDAYDALLEGGGGAEGGVGIAEVRGFVGRCGLAGGDAEKVLEIVGGGGARVLGRDEFNVLLALVGLAQEGEELSLDAVDERRSRLPEPSLPHVKPARPPPPQQQNTTASSSQGPGRQQSFGALESDPWGAPAMHKGHDHAQQEQGSYTNGGAGGPTRTTSGFTTASVTAPVSAPTGFEASTAQAAVGGEGVGWGADNAFGGEQPGFDAPQPSNGHGASTLPIRSGSYGGKRISSTIEEEVTVNLLDEKEGMFLFQHRNYEVGSTRKNSKVIRRYSDFVWLLDCLYKRFPFRQLPLLPPKRVAINGNHIAGDALFLEKRRRGLARFANALVRHPVLGQEQLVVMFLTVPTELAVWRKQATISVQEEFVGKSLPPGLEDSLPEHLPQLFDTVRAGVRKSAELYINLCNMVEKLAKYNVALASEYVKLSLSLDLVTEASGDMYAIDTNDVPLLNEGIKSLSKHFTANKDLLEEEGRAWDLGALEDFKRQRDCLVSVREMFDRRDRYAKDNIPQLERRIESNESKLVGLRAKPEGTFKPSEVERLEDAIIKDKQSIVDQHARGVFIKECIRDEVRYFNTSQYHVGRLTQDWSQERVKFSELQADNWRRLADEVDSMPTAGGD